MIDTAGFPTTITCGLRAARQLGSLLCAIGLFGGMPLAHADLLPPGYEEAERRMKTGVWDREDNYCAGSKEGAACTIPGTPFQGGGSGHCRRELPRGATHIDLLCVLEMPPKIERDLPNGPFQADADTCELIKRKVVQVDFLQCAAPPPVADRFCRGLKEGDPCRAEVRVGPNFPQFDGRCEAVRETRRYYNRGYNVTERATLQCNPVEKLPEPVLKPVGLLRKLLP